MNKLLTALLVVFTLISCEKSETSSSDLFTFIPEGSSYILSTSSIPEFLAKLDTTKILNMDYIQSGFKFSAIKEYTQLLPASKSLIAFTRKDSVSYNFLLIAEAKKDTLLIKNHPNFSVESISTKELDYKKISLNNEVTYSAFIDNTILASSSKKLLLEAAKLSDSKIKRSESFNKAIAAASLEKSALFINHANLKSKSGKNKLSEDKLDRPIADWSVIDLDIGTTKINFNGISVSNANSKNILDIFRNIQHQKNELQNIVPISAYGFYSFTYNDFKNVDANLKKFRKDSLVLNDNNLLNFTKEAGVIFLKGDMAVGFNTTDAELAKGSFPEPEVLLTEYRGISIYSSPENSPIKFLEPLIAAEGLNVYAFLDNFLVYTKDQEALEQIISNYQNNTTYSKQQSFIDLQSDLAESSSLLMVATPKLVLDQEQEYGSLPYQIQQDFVPFLSKNYSYSAIQFVQSDGFSHIHGTIGKGGSAQDEETQKTATISLPKPISGDPFLFAISSKTNAIAYQDLNNVLYVVSSQGKTLWKKQLDSKILGELQQIDLRKNGNQQLAFATLNNFFLVDEKGKEVKGFPVKFKDLITQPLAIFDYDNNRNYRFVITQKDKLLMYDAKGNAINGFAFNGASSEIIQPPKHIRIKNKDYIVVPEENGKLHILSRQGKERISVNGKIEFSESAWYENSNSFVSLSEDSKLLKIDSNGKISKQKVEGSNGLKITANENVLVFLSENILKINKKEIQLDFGLYTNPRIHKLGGNSYISIADTQAKKVYLFTENGELLPNFPVYGIGFSGITNNGKARTALIMGEGDEVIFYSF